MKRKNFTCRNTNWKSMKPWKTPGQQCTMGGSAVCLTNWNRCTINRSFTAKVAVGAVVAPSAWIQLDGPFWPFVEILWNTPNLSIPIPKQWEIQRPNRTKFIWELSIHFLVREEFIMSAAMGKNMYTLRVLPAEFLIGCTWCQLVCCYI